jgi:hypothetical protein
MVVVTDHDSRVLARRTFRCRAWDLGAALDWAAEWAAAKGWAGVTGGWVYVGKMMFGLFSEVALGRFSPGTVIVVVITG